jgi:Probable cobalt transporter subunit (CbtA)
MIGSLLLRGLVAGLIAGIAAGAFGFASGEPQIDRAIALEARAAPAGPQAAEAGKPLVSRSGQRAGLVAATALYGLAVGGIFALGFAAVRGRMGPLGDLSTAAGLGAALFLAVVLVPFLKYPANPPGVGDSATIGSRTALHLVMVATSLLAVLAAWRVGRRVSAVAAPATGAVAAAAVYLGTVGVTMAVLPGVDEVPAGFDATLLWDFRVAALGTQLVLWSTLAVVFGAAVQRTGRHRRAARAG